MTISLCPTCRHVKQVVTGRGSQFLLCQLSNQDRRYAKYPRQPLIECPGYVKLDNEQSANNDRQE